MDLVCSLVTACAGLLVWALVTTRLVPLVLLSHRVSTPEFAAAVGPVLFALGLVWAVVDVVVLTPSEAVDLATLERSDWRARTASESDTSRFLGGLLTSVPGPVGLAACVGGDVAGALAFSYHAVLFFPSLAIGGLVGAVKAIEAA